MSLSSKEAACGTVADAAGKWRRRRGGSDGNGGCDGSSFDENHPAPAALY